MKSSENYRFSRDFRGYGGEPIRLNLLNVINIEIWRQSLIRTRKTFSLMYLLFFYFHIYFYDKFSSSSSYFQEF